MKRKQRQDTATANGRTDENSDNAGAVGHNVVIPVRVSEDFPLRVTKARTNLYPFLKSCHDREKAAYLRYDTLVVNGQAYVFDEACGRPVPVKWGHGKAQVLLVSTR